MRGALTNACAVALLVAPILAAPALLPLAYEDARALAVRDADLESPRFEIHQRVRVAWLPLPAERVVAVDRATFLARVVHARPAASAVPVDPDARAELLFLFTGERGDPLWVRHRVERFESEARGTSRAR